MLQHLFGTRSFTGIDLHSHLQKINGRWINLLAALFQLLNWIGGLDLLLDIGKCLARVRKLPCEEHVGNHASTPYVDLVVVPSILFQQFRSNVESSTSWSIFSAFKWSFHRESEICKANVEIFWVFIAATTLSQEQNVF